MLPAQVTVSAEHRYKVANGAHLSEQDAQIIGTCIQQLTERLGRSPKATELYQEALNIESPLHPHVFICDQEEAAKRFFIGRCYYLLRSIHIETIAADKTVTVRAFVNIKVTKSERAYFSIQQAVLDDHLRKQLIDEAEATFKSAYFRYRTLLQYAETHERAPYFTAAASAIEQQFSVEADSGVA